MATSSLAIAPTSRPMILPALLLTSGMIVVILSAFYFQYVELYTPCALCLLERWPYYIGIPIGILALVSSTMNAPPAVTRTLLLLAALTMLTGAGMGVYHAGAEWKFWPGPSTCSTSASAISTDVKDMFEKINTEHGPSCTDAPWHLWGLSFAGWNVVASTVLAGIAVFGATRKA